MAWDIIGWIILGVVALLILARIASIMLGYLAFATSETPEPRRHQRLMSPWGNRYYITNVTDYSVVVSTTPGNNGGLHIGFPEWAAKIKRERLFVI